MVPSQCHVYRGNHICCGLTVQKVGDQTTGGKQEQTIGVFGESPTPDQSRRHAPASASVC